MPNIGGWDTGFGASYMTGSVEEGKTDPAMRSSSMDGGLMRKYRGWLAACRWVFMQATV